MARVVVNYGKTLTELGRMAHRMGHPEGGLKRVGQYVKGLSQQSFKDSADPTTHERWDQLSDVTIELRRNKNREGTEILIDTSRLRKSISHFITGKRKVVVGTATKYGKIHQFGGITSPRSMIPNKKIPARPFLGFDRAGEKEIERIMKRWILGEK
jgi:phage virion morphogenesis protein